MKKKSHSSFRNSDMDRVKPRKHVFRTLIDKNLKRRRYPSETGLVEDGTNSTTVIRMIVGLLLIHLIVIGGVILRGKIKSGESGAIAAPTITAPPAATEPVSAPANDVLPQPIDGPVANPVRNESNHITQAPTEPATPTAPAVAATPEPEIITPVVEEVAEVAVEEPAAPAQPAAEPAAPTFAKHLVSSGETLFGIAAKHQVTVEAIRQANPQVRNNNIISGTYLNIPVKADSPAGREIAARQAEAEAAQVAATYTVKRGDTLARIAKKHKTTTQKIMKLNNIAPGRERYIRPGDTLKVSE